MSKGLHGRWTTKSDSGRVNGVTTTQNVLIDGMPHHVKDMQPIVGPSSLTNSSDVFSEKNRIVTIA